MSEEESKPTRRPGRGGVEVRVFGEGRRESDGDRGDSDFPEDEEVAESWDEGEEVVRLDSRSGPLANRRIEDEEQFDPVPLEEPKRKLGLRGLTFLMAGIAILLAVAIVSVAMVFNRIRSEEDRAVMPLRVVDEPIAEQSIEADLFTDADGLIDQSIKLFQQYSKAETVDDVVGLICDGEQLRPILAERWKPLGALRDQFNGRVMEDDGRYFVVLSGRMSSGEGFEFVFLPEGDDWKIDWESSVAYGDVDPGALRGIEVGRTVKMRVHLWPSNFHPLEYPEEEFRCFRIRHGSEAESIYAYAKVGSKVANDLSEALNEGTVLFRQEQAVAVIIRLRNGGRGELGQFVVTEFLRKGWIER